MSLQKETPENPWGPYYEKMRGRPPRQTLLRALAALDSENRAPGQAVDLGAGNGRDALELLRRGWRVLAIDQAPEGLAEIAAAAPALAGALETRQAPMEDCGLPPADLVNASFCLFLLSAQDLKDVMARLHAALKPGGRFAGHFLGPKDSWAGQVGVTALTRAEVETLLCPLEIEWLWEEEDDGVTPRGEAKHWHLFHLVARKTP